MLPNDNLNTLVNSVYIIDEERKAKCRKGFVSPREFPFLFSFALEPLQRRRACHTFNEMGPAG